MTVEEDKPRFVVRRAGDFDPWQAAATNGAFSQRRLVAFQKFMNARYRVQRIGSVEVWLLETVR